MTDVLQRLKQRKLVQWALAYLAAAWVLLQVLGLARDSYGWPRGVMQLAFGVLALGFVVTLVLAWYHGERGAQKLSGTELLILALLLAIGGGLLWRLAPAPNTATNGVAATPSTIASPIRAASVTPIPAKSIAVLPFENLSNDKSNEYFAAGIQDEILTKLASLGDLKVISRTSTAQYASKPENLREVARELGVATVLEGSVQKAGNEVRVNVQLIDARTDNHIWAQTYDRELKNVFAVESDVAEQIADALKVKLGPAEAVQLAAAPTHDPVAYDLYLKAQGIEDQVAAGGWAAIPVAIAAYRKVIQRDPDFALAYTQVAFMQALLHWTGANRSPTVMRKAEANVRKALTLQPDLPQAHLVLGYVYRWGYNDYAKALAEYKLASAGLPNSADVAEAIAYIHEVQGDMPAAIAQMQRAMTLGPRDPHLPCQLAIMYATTGNYPRARQALARAFAINPTDAEAYGLLSKVDLLENGDAAAALALLDQAPAAIQTNGLLIGARIDALLLQRNFVAARQYAKRLRPGQGLSALQIAQTEGNVQWLSGAREDATPFYTKALGLLKAQLPTTTRPMQAHAELALAAARLGRRDESLGYGRKVAALVAQKGLIPHDRGITPWATLAAAYASLGDSDEALAALRKTLARASGLWISAPMLKLDPTWDPIRNDPRFQALLKKYGGVGTKDADDDKRAAHD